MATLAQRAHMQALMAWLVSERSHIGYDATRPMHVETVYEQVLANEFAAAATPTTTVIEPDCSECVSMLCHMAGLQDPNGVGYDDYGSTEYMYGHLGHYTTAVNAHIGAIVVFGAGNSSVPVGQHHAAMVYTPAADPMLFSHGTPQGPGFVRYSALVAALPSPATFLDVGSL